MLVAACEGKRVEAQDAERGLAYVCPNPKCCRPLILKRGRIVIAHFAHKPPKDCDWARGETLAHLEAKRLIRDAFAARGVRAEVEYVVPALPGDRRADVMMWSPSGIKVVVELQHTSIGVDEIERRAFSYARAEVAQVWVPFLRTSIWADAERRDGGGEGDWLVERYPARPYERWVHGLNRGGIWFYDPSDKVIWRGRFARHQIWEEERSWYSEDGEERYAGGYPRWSRRWRELTLWGPHGLDQVKIKLERRCACRTGRYNWPAGHVGQFVVEGE